MSEIRVKSTGTIKLFESDNTSSVTIASPASLGGDRTITIPDADVDLTNIAVNTAKTSNATHSGEVTGATALTIADNIVDEANLKISNSAVNGYMLTAQSGASGGLTWAAAGGGKVIQMKFSGGGSELMTSSSFNSTGLSVTITPTTTANEILVIAMSPRSYISGIEALYTAIYRGTSGEGSGSSIVQCQNERGGVSGNQRFTNNMMMLDAPSSTSDLTYTVMHRNNNNSTLVGWFEGGEVGNSIIVAMEVDIA